jgi:hypothetical protein
MFSHRDAFKLRVTTADGTPLRFSSNLLNFLARQARDRAFHLSDWLQSLDEDMLAHLRQLAEQALHDSKALGAAAVEDLLSLVLHALAAERRTDTLEFKEAQMGEYVALLGLLATLESLRRKGLLSYESVMSIELDAANTVVMDKEMMARSEAVEAQIRRSWH